jgi:2-polyprenyl-6-methoxyphenol hydroxylase-like FAD-dependent oxidoreductase
MQIEAATIAPHQPGIAIIGGGPAGLTAARILQLHGRQVCVFEAEPSTDVRDQGGTLDLHADTGQRALALAGLTAPFRTAARDEDQGDRLVDHATAAVLFEDPVDGDRDRPEIDRRMLRDLLLDSLTPGTVRWGHKLRAIERDDQAGKCRYRLVWAHGPTDTFDVVIGADGAWSRVRSFLSDATPHDTGITFVECWLDDVDARHPELAALVGRGTMFALHAGQGIIAQRNANAHIRVYAVFHAPVDWARRQGVDLEQPAAVRAAVLDKLTEWSPGLLALIACAGEVFVNRRIYALAPDFAWQPQRGVTLVGDAAHLMPPVGVGVNLAMLDAAELALALAEPDWPTAVARHEQAMIARAHSLAAEAASGFAKMFADDAPAAVLHQMQHRYPR